jgi:predicted HTH transcriptional regulator
MSPESGLMLRRLLKLRDGAERILRTRENTQIEFKQSFNLASMPKYARTMAAYANTDGGFIVYGVKNAPHELVGINLERFEAADPAKVTSFLNAHCSPEIQWEMGTLELSGTVLGFIYTHVQYRKPVITTTSSGEELKEGEIYYRYRGQTTSTDTLSSGP